MKLKILHVYSKSKSGGIKMTTEIAIMNRRGIALAADSVSSLVVTDEIREEDKVKKTYSNMKKLFNISQDYPVGIMTYSSANFMSIPWEVIIEDFRKEIVNNNYRYNSLEEYGDKLINYIKNNYQLSGDDFKGFLFKKYYRRLLVKIARKIYWELKDAEDKGNRQQIHERVVEEFLKELGDSECNLELQKSELKKIKQFVDEGLPELIEDVIGKKYVSDKMISNLKTIALEIIRKEKKMPEFAWTQSKIMLHRKHGAGV